MCQISVDGGAGAEQSSVAMADMATELTTDSNRAVWPWGSWPVARYRQTKNAIAK